jgi:hypothetical protein
VEVVHSDMFTFLHEQLVLLPPSLFRHITQLLHVKTESLFQRVFQFGLVRSSRFSCLVRDRLEQTQDHFVVRDCSGCIGCWRLGRGALAQTLYFGREARPGTGLRKLRLKRAYTREEDLVTSDLGL